MKITLKLKTHLLFALLLSSFAQSTAQVNEKNAGQFPSTIFKVDQPDFKLSPYTGMTRKHWKEAAFYLLKEAFSYVKTVDDPMLFPKQEVI